MSSNGAMGEKESDLDTDIEIANNEGMNRSNSDEEFPSEEKSGTEEETRRNQELQDEQGKLDDQRDSEKQNSQSEQGKLDDQSKRVSQNELNLENSITEDNLVKHDSQIDKRKVMRHFIFPIFFCYLELVFHLLVFRSLDGTIVFPLLFASAFGFFVDFITSYFPLRINKVLSWIVMVIGCLTFGTQLVFNHIFKTFLSIYSVGENGGDVMEFWKEALDGILAVFPGLLLIVLPLPIFALVLKKWIQLERETMGKAIFSLGLVIGIHMVVLLFLFIPGKGAHTPFDLYYNDNLMDLSIQKLGLLTSIRADMKNVFLGGDELALEHDAFLHVALPTVTPSLVSEPPTDPVANTSSSKGEDKISDVPSITPTPTPAPVDRSPNVLAIDFEKLSQEESKESIKTLHTYFSMAQPTNKNEYTGMFEGYNFIFLTAEGFSPWAIDKEVTPTLYRMTNEGFVFNNFYTPIWYTSTSDGEYVACTGLIPSGTNSFSKSSENALPFAFGWQFQKLGYSARAYHNHSYTYYNRHLTHPNMGYLYKGAKGGGLDVELTWPESDLEMMELTIPEFIQDEKFHVYYMTVSGHLQYNFTGNTMARKNKAYVENLPYSENVKAYIASQKELDLALEYLIKELEKAGVLDKTVIALSADHYPYGLTNEEISEVAGHTIEENFELYKNNFILWNSSMKEPVLVEKFCSSMDIIPTLCNLFGIEYDSRLFMGQDILSDAKPLVMFGNQSFITEEIMYNSKSGEVIPLTDTELPEDYVKQYISFVKNKFNVSASILKHDYYSYLLPYLPEEQSMILGNK